jgi:ankyrin repeat protein
LLNSACPGQEKDTWLSPLHFAVSRGLLETAMALVESGADVNVVGANDVMPLSLAYTSKNNATSETVTTYENIIQFLLLK